MALTDKLSNIADAIRTKTETTGKMTLTEMPDKILGIQTSEDLDAELTEQQQLISELKTTLEGKAAGGGVSSWNDLTDKPFGEYTPEPIIRNSSTEGSSVVDLLPDNPGIMLGYKVSDKVYTADQLVGANITYVSSTDERTEQIVAVDDITDIPDQGMTMVGTKAELLVLIARNNNFLGLETGTYFITGLSGYVSSLAFAEQVKKLDAKYLPNMRINITENDDGSFSADKTYAEIEAAILEGTIPYCVYYGTMLYLSSADALRGISPRASDPSITFFAINMSGTSSTNLMSCSIDNGNGVNVSTYKLTLT